MGKTCNLDKFYIIWFPIESQSFHTLDYSPSYMLFKITITYLYQAITSKYQFAMPMDVTHQKNSLEHIAQDKLYPNKIKATQPFSASNCQRPNFFFFSINQSIKWEIYMNPEEHVNT